MAKLKALLLTEGYHGMISQVEGLAKALGAEFHHKIVRLSWPWNYIPPKFTPKLEIILKDKKYLSENEHCDLVISCGRKSVIPSILLKKKNKNIFTIHIQNPKVNFNNFDTIVAPDHDGISGSNIITSRGSIHYLTLEEINKSRFYLEKNIEKNKDIITLILGGPNKYYNYSEENIKNILYRINDYIDKYNLQLIIIPSNRTPKKIIDTIKNIRSNYLIVDKVDKQAYLSSLSLSKYIVVTCDSTSMISEAALTGKPIYVAMIPATKNDYRFKKFRDLFKELNIIRELGDSLEIWDYERLDETNRIAQEIKKKLS